eukprot:13652797-Ditylum_brightwellii.AAC.1
MNHHPMMVGRRLSTMQSAATTTKGSNSKVSASFTVNKSAVQLSSSTIPAALAGMGAATFCYPLDVVAPSRYLDENKLEDRVEVMNVDALIDIGGAVGCNCAIGMIGYNGER